MFNEQLARNALKNIKEHREDWQQGDWRCGTSMCFAGFVAFEAGAGWANWSHPCDAMVKTPDGKIEHVEYFAAKELGLREAGIPAWDLFSPINSLEMLEAKINHYAKLFGG